MKAADTTVGICLAGISLMRTILMKRGIALCVEQADTGTRELLGRILVDAEEHIHWLKTQTTLVEKVGYENYCARQILPG